MNDNIIAAVILLLYFSPIFYQLIIVLKENKKGNKLPLKKFGKYLKYSLLILLLFIGLFGVICHTNYLNYEKPMIYDRYDSITFENFRGLEFFKKSLYGNEKFAYIVTTIESKIEDDFVTVESLFHPSRSFVYNNQAHSTELLTHEKYHFKITELYVRKAKKRIADLNNPERKEIEIVLMDIKKEERAYQKKYDFDTFHSYVLSEQKKYEKDIDSQLNKLNRFNIPKISINDFN